MKEKIIIFLSIILVSNAYAQSTKDLLLKSKVKNIIEDYSSCPMIVPTETKADCFERKTTYDFDKKGNPLLGEQKAMNTEYIVEKTQNENGYILVKYLERNGKKVKMNEEYYNNDGLKEKFIDFQPNGEIVNIWEFSYDTKQRLSETRKTNFWENIKTLYTHTYNTFGDIILSKKFENDQLISEEPFKIDYTFDKKGNWNTKRIESKQNYVELFKRSITYY